MWSADGGWLTHRFRLADPNFWDQFAVPPGIRISAQARKSDIIDLSAVGKDSAVYATWWNALHGWAGLWLRI